MTELCLTPALGTHRGRRREDNEDAVGFRYPTDINRLREHGAVFVVADGVGGLSDGQNASHIAANGVIDAYYANLDTTAEGRLAAAVAEVNHVIHNQFGGKSATTLTVAVFLGDEVIVAHVGDTRAYWFDGFTITQITQDQTLAVTKPNGNVKHKLLQAVGKKPTVEPAVTRHAVRGGGQLLLISDGVTRYLDENTLTGVLAGHPPPEAVTEIVRQSNQGGGIDNISAVVVAVGARAENDADLLQHISTRFAAGIHLNLPPTLGIAKQAASDSPAQTMIESSPPGTTPILPGVPPRPVDPKPQPEPTPPPPETERRGGMKWLLTGALLVALGTAGWFMFLPILQGEPAATITAVPATDAPRTDAPATVAPPTQTPLPPPTITLIPPNIGLVSGVEVVFGASLTAYARIGSDVAAFTVEANTSYTVVDEFTTNDGVRWYRLNVPADNQHGWIADYDLPDYQVQN